MNKQFTKIAYFLNIIVSNTAHAEWEICDRIYEIQHVVS